MSQATASAELSTPPRRYSLAIFFCLAFGVSWAVWLPAVAVVLGAEAPAFNHPPVLDAYPADLTARIPWLALLPAVFLQQVLLGSSLGEEPGWRGYA
ncbi:MAG TPA: hypothetical protein VKA58_10285, partial [Propionibacteriaceae bacterium]|nr:hypothetical protein [Propionibacteriaceae bacterium]